MDTSGFSRGGNETPAEQGRELGFAVRADPSALTGRFDLYVVVWPVCGRGRGSCEAGVQYRFYPSDVQTAELARTFGCVRKVYNLALAARTEGVGAAGAGQLRPDVGDVDRVEADRGAGYLGDVSSVPLQQTLRHL